MQHMCRRLALYLSQEGEHDQETMKLAQVYCEQHGYRLWKGEISQDDLPDMALDWIRDVVNALTPRLLLLPSLTHLHPAHLGAILTFLIEMQEANVEILCLDHTPTSLKQFTLAIVPLTQEQQGVGAISLPEIIRCLRFR